MYSQGEEEALILSYFGGHVGRFLDIGAHNGRCGSNTLRLVELGWSGVCVEPSPIPLMQLIALHGANPRVQIVDAVIAPESKLVPWWDSSGEQVSSLDVEQFNWLTKDRGFPTSQFSKFLIKTTTMEELLDAVGVNFDFVNLDVERMNNAILMQFPMSLCKRAQMMCVENESPQDTGARMQGFLAPAGLTLLKSTGCNLLFGRHPL